MKQNIAVNVVGKTNSKMRSISIIFPHQLFKESPLFSNSEPIYLVEEFLFFNQYAFHKQKIAFHRATMKAYEHYLTSKNVDVTYIEATSANADIRVLLPQLSKKGITHINYIDPTDNWLELRITKACEKLKISKTTYDSPLFLNTENDLSVFFRKDKKKYYQTKFYTDERKKRNILITNDGKPMGGKWTFDTENRKKYPVKKIPPPIHFPDVNTYYEEAISYVSINFSQNLGSLTPYSLYPTSFEATNSWLDQFLEQRFSEFGHYEDAIVKEHSILNHSVLTPMLNVGLILPQQVISKTLNYANKNSIPLNSTEGFIRQIIGWREFMRGMYSARGSHQRTTNFWGFKKKIPASFYTGSTGIPPIDQTIKKVLQTGYCHHIERLMVLGNFMLLCEFDPDEVYRWFMELFIDAYDWVMVPNVYGMSQFADGGLLSTKPYISGSNYLMKMSNYKKGEWQETWDGLFWRFMDTHRDFFLKNPRLRMLVSMFDKMPLAKRVAHLHCAESYLESID